MAFLQAHTPNLTPHPAHVAPLANQKWPRGERGGGASLRYALLVPIRGERWSEWSEYTETNTTYITLCFTMYIMVQLGNGVLQSGGVA